MTTKAYTTAAARLAAILSQTSHLVFAEGVSRDAVIANARAYLGKTPTKEALDTWKEQATIGRMALKLPFRKGESEEARMLKAADLKRNYADPLKADRKNKQLKQGLKGYRTADQHKVQRAAIEHTNLLLRDAFPAASERKEGQADKNKSAARRKAGGATNQQAKAAAPSHAQLVEAPKPESASDVMAYLTTQSRSIADFCKKNAKVCPADAGKAVEAFRTAILAAANALQEHLAAADKQAA